MQSEPKTQQTHQFNVALTQNWLRAVNLFIRSLAVHCMGYVKGLGSILWVL